MGRVLVVVLLLLAASPVTAPFSIQEIAALPGADKVAHAKKAGDDSQPALAGLASVGPTVPDRVHVPQAKLAVHPPLAPSLSLPLRL